MITDLSRDFLVYRGYQGPKATLDYYWFRFYGRNIIAPRTEPQSKTWQAQQQAQQARRGANLCLQRFATDFARARFRIDNIIVTRIIQSFPHRSCMHCCTNSRLLISLADAVTQ